MSNYCNAHAPDITGPECDDDKPCDVCTKEAKSLIKENTWCDCDQMPGLHNPCDCDNEKPVADAKHWLIENVKELFERIIPGTSNLEVNVTVTPYAMSVSIDVTEQFNFQNNKG